MKRHLNRTVLALGFVVTAATLAGCDRDDEIIPVATQAKPASTIPDSLVKDPSLPDASQVIAKEDQAKQAVAGGQDTRANDPAGTLTKQEEKTEMPKGGQTNNYMTPSTEGGSKH